MPTAEPKVKSKPQISDYTDGPYAVASTCHSGGQPEYEFEDEYGRTGEDRTRTQRKRYSYSKSSGTRPEAAIPGEFGVRQTIRLGWWGYPPLSE